jgi:hypothetical protein
MSLPLSGQISMAQIDDALAKSTTGQLSLNDTDARGLAKILTQTISLSDFYGKVLNMTNDNGWFTGGFNVATDITTHIVPLSTVERLVFVSDTNTANVRGSLSSSQALGASTFNNTDGWFRSSSVDRITFSQDTITAQHKFNLDGSWGSAGSTDFSTYGWFAGGIYSPYGIMMPIMFFAEPYALANILSTVSKLTFAIDSNIPLIKGPLSVSREYLGSASTTTGAWFVGGLSDKTWQAGAYNNVTSLIDKITYSSDLSVASGRGPLQVWITAVSSVQNSTNAWFIGLYGSIGLYSCFQRITFSNDLVLSVTRGSLLIYAYNMSGSSNNTTDGWFAGGILNDLNSGLMGRTTSTINKLTFATDTAQASVRGSLTIAKTGMSSV